MDKFFDYLEDILVTVWNKLYEYLCGVFEMEVDEDLYIDSLNPNED